MPKHATLVRSTWGSVVRSIAGIGLSFISVGRGYLHSDPWEEWRRGRACKIKSTEFTFEVVGLVNMVDFHIIWPPVKLTAANQLHMVRDLMAWGEWQ